MELDSLVRDSHCDLGCMGDHHPCWQGGALMPRRRMRSEFGGVDSAQGVPVNPMKPVATGSSLSANHRLRLVYTTGYESTLMPLNRRAWLGGQPYPPLVAPSRIPRQ